MPDACNSNGKLVLPSELRELERVDALTLECTRKAGLPEDQAMMVAIAVVEAVTNGIVHGNNFADDKVVTLEFACKPGLIKVIVHDEGKGFDMTCVWDPTSPDHQMDCSGRGIYIMREVMDSVEFDMSDGTTVVMTKAV
ncbi:MAG: ATP-binding protein [Candidatus Eisenbacteria bacterium]